MSEKSIEKAYDEIVYDSVPQIQGNLRLLETIADLFELEPVDVNQARVLELGCATGHTLLAQAGEFPQSSFLGIDLSGVQIEYAANVAQNLGLSNLEFRRESLMNIDASWGKFDYIIAHGVYSWVPDSAQRKILEICESNLSDRGIAMISYNTYPGWYFKTLIRDLMRFHIEHDPSSGNTTEKIRAAREILENLFQKRKNDTRGIYGKYLEEMNKLVQSSGDGYVFHEYLESENSPCYFEDFCRRLHAKNLKHVSDFTWTDFQKWSNRDSRLSFGDSESLTSEDISEQYLDFFINRSFRSSVISCKGIPHRFRESPWNRYSYALRNTSEIGPIEYENKWRTIIRNTGNDVEIFENDPVLVSLGRVLEHNRFRFLPYRELLLGIARDMSEPEGLDESQEKLVASYLERFVKTEHLWMLLHAPTPPQRTAQNPQVSPFNRYMLEKNGKFLTTPLFENCSVEELTRWIISRLDGQRRISRIVSELHAEILEGKRTFTFREKPLQTDPPEALGLILDEIIAELSKNRLLLPGNAF